MTSHQAKKLDIDALIAFRDRFALPLTDEQAAALEFYKPAENSAELRYVRARRDALGGYLPARRRNAESVTVPPLKAYAEFALKARARNVHDHGRRPAIQQSS